MWVLHAEIFKYSDRSGIDIFDQSPTIGLDACDPFLRFDGTHELYDVVNDIFSEENFGLVERKLVFAEEVPADGGSGTINTAQPVLRHCGCLYLVLDRLQLIVLHHFLHRNFDLHFSLIAEG